MSSPLLSRSEIFSAFDHREYDVIIVGGGIVGAGIAREAAANNLSTLVLEKKDFSWGTSSRSSKLVHGGIRYLEQLDFRLVFEALSERTKLLKIGPVEPMPFLFPTYKGDRPPAWFLELGMILYDALALFRAPKLHRFHGKNGTLKLAPNLDPNNLQSASEYYDAKTDDSRLVIETIRGARRLGAHALNYAEVKGFGVNQAKRIETVQVKDVLSGKEYEAKGKVFINAAGPWLEKMIHLVDKNHPKVIRASKGVHLFTRSQPGDSKKAIVLSDSKTKRILFYVPWKPGVNLVGTTDTDYKGDFDNVYADKNDVDYILENYKQKFPTGIDRKDILSSNAGLRPLIFAEGHDERTTSREHRIIVHEPYNLVSIGGGKLTTYRVMARHTLEKAVGVLKKNGDNKIRLLPNNQRIIGGQEIQESSHIGNEAAKFMTEYFGYVDVGLRVNDYCSRDTSLSMPVGDPRLTRGLIKYMVEEEMVMRLEDLMDRRLRFSLTEADGGLSNAQTVASELGANLGWGRQRIAEEIKLYETEVRKNRAPLQ